MPTVSTMIPVQFHRTERDLGRISHKSKPIRTLSNCFFALLCTVQVCAICLSLLGPSCQMRRGATIVTRDVTTLFFLQGFGFLGRAQQTAPQPTCLDPISGFTPPDTGKWVHRTHDQAGGATTGTEPECLLWWPSALIPVPSIHNKDDFDTSVDTTCT